MAKERYAEDLLKGGLNYQVLYKGRDISHTILGLITTTKEDVGEEEYIFSNVIQKIDGEEKHK